MSTPVPDLACRNCARVHPETDLDQYGWCNACRAVVIRRATWVARIVGVMGALGVAALAFGAFNPGPRTLILWLVLIAATYFFLYKLTQRVSFELIRARGVPAPDL